MKNLFVGNNIFLFKDGQFYKNLFSNKFYAYLGLFFNSPEYYLAI